MPDPAAVEAFVDACAQKTDSPGLFNPWRERCAHDLHTDAPARRRTRLAAHLSTDDAQLILVGEAPGYQGCRYSGCAFTSERLLLEGAIPRMPALGGERLTDRPRPFSEPSATIVWSALYEAGIAETTVLWNACPWHPAKDQPWSNRTPSREEALAGLPILLMLRDLFPEARFAAVGRVAQGALAKAGIEAPALRHPARGGATAFREGLMRYS
jgi:uracil-DNA glycosylase